jgi:Na+/melibiose symporter-like transporter
MRQLLAHRNARLYLSGQVMSLLGDGALWLAMGIWIKVLTGSSSAAGLSFFALALGSLCGPLGGMLADKVRRRPLLIETNLATAGLVLLLLLVRDRDQVWLIYAVMLGYGVSGSILGPAQTALVQAIVPAELLGEANSVLQTAQQGLRLVTPLAGAGLFAVFGPAPVIIGDAATFLVAVATLVAIRLRERRPAPSGQRWLAELTAGARHIAGTIVLRQLTITAAVVVTAYGLSETVIFAVVSQGLHRPTTFLGILVAAQGAGAIAAGLSAAPLMGRLTEGLLAGLGMILAAAGFLLLIPSQLPAVLAGCVLLGGSISWIIVGIMTLFQRRTPPELMGRTDAAFTIAYTVPQTMAIALGAGLIALLNYRILLLAIAGLMALAAGYLCTRREQRPTADAQPRPVMS